MGYLPSRGLLCPQCGYDADALAARRSIKLAPTAFWDDVDLTLYACDECGFRGTVLHLDSGGHGSLDDDTHSLEGHRLTEQYWTQLDETIGRCPDKSNENCACEAHRELKRMVVVDTGRRHRDGGVVAEFDVTWTPLAQGVSPRSTAIDVRVWDDRDRPLVERFERLAEAVEGWDRAGEEWQCLDAQEGRLGDVGRAPRPLGPSALRARARELARPGRRLMTGIAYRGWRIEKPEAGAGSLHLELWCWDRAWIDGNGRDLRLEGDASLWLSSGDAYRAVPRPGMETVNARVAENVGDLVQLLARVAGALRPRSIKAFTTGGESLPLNAHVLAYASSEAVLADLRLLALLWRDGLSAHAIPPLARVDPTTSLLALHARRTPAQRIALHQRLAALVGASARVTAADVERLVASGRFFHLELHPGFLLLDRPHPFNAFLDRFYLELLEAAGRPGP